MRTIIAPLLLSFVLLASPAQSAPPPELLAALSALHLQMPPSVHVRIREALGRGSFGTVYRARFNSQEYAVKVFECEDGSEWSETYCALVKDFVKEMEILVRLRGSSQIIQLLGWYPPNGRLSFGILMPLMRMDLSQFMKQYKTGLPRELIQRIAPQIAVGLAHCHRLGVDHCDLKPSNIMLDEHYNVRIIDFNSANADETDGELPICTLYWRAPEWVLRGPYTHAGDVWSFACILYQMITGNHLFPATANDYSEINHFFRTCRLIGTPTRANWPGVECRPNYSDHFPQWMDRRETFFTETLASVPEYIQIVIAAIALNPAERPSSEDLLRMFSERPLVSVVE